MRYELYADSLFLINFIMNLYLLILVDRSTFRIAVPWRLAAGAALGAAVFLLPFLWNAPAALKLAAAILAGTVGMLYTAFPVKGLRMFLKLLERLLLYSFGMGGAMVFAVRCLGGTGVTLTGILGAAGAGGVIFLLFCRLKPSADLKNGLCRVTLLRKGKSLRVTALIDSGNSLREPVSGKSVCVVERELFDRLWDDDRSTFRAIPYHSIGKKRGIMPGYLLPELKVEADGMKLRFEDVYIAVSDEEISRAESAEGESVKMIMNPGLFAESKKGKPRGRQNERHNDTEGNATGQDAV